MSIFWCYKKYNTEKVYSKQIKCYQLKKWAVYYCAALELETKEVFDIIIACI